MTKFSFQNRIALILISSLALSAGLGGAFAQQGNGTATVDAAVEPEITIDAGFATFSYGVLYIGVTVENVMPDLDKVTIEYYNPDGALEGSRSETLFIENGTGAFSCYCFGVDREYVEESYSVVAVYGNYSESRAMPPFSSAYPQPPSISFHAADQDDFGVRIGGRVSGGISGEEVGVAIYSGGGAPLWDRTVGTNTKAIFDTSMNSSEAQELLPTGTYRVVATHVATGIAGEETLEYVNPVQADEPEQEPAKEPEPKQQAPEPEQPAATQPDDEEAVNEPRGRITSPFVFSDEGEAGGDGGDAQAIPASLSAGNNAVKASDKEALVMNGTLASYYVMEGDAAQGTTAGLSRLYILSGNWSMTVNSTAVTGFAANFTIVRADGAARGEYSLGNFEPVDASGVLLGPDSLAFASTADLRAGGNATAIGVMVTVEKFSAVRIEFGGDPMQPVGRPIYGVVDSLALGRGL